MKQRTAVLLATCCFALLAGTSAGSARTVDLILVAGQSNAVGYDANPAELPADPADKQVLFWWRCGDPPPDEHDSTSKRTWTTLQAQPVGNPSGDKKAARQYGNFRFTDGGFGPEIGLARTLHRREKKPLAVVKVAFSGTGMRTDWNPADPGPGGACYRALIAETRAAVNAAKADGLILRIRALVWVQGESDARAGDAPNYERALGALIDAVRRELEAPDMMALLAVNTRFGEGSNPFVPQIVKAQKALAAKDPRCAYIDTSGAPIANAFHFNTEGTLQVGRLFAEALVEMEAAKRGK